MVCAILAGVLYHALLFPSPLFSLSLPLSPSLAPPFTSYRLVLYHCPSIFAGVCLSLRSRLIRSASSAQEVCGAVIKPDRS